MAKFKSTLLDDLVNESQLPELPVRVEIPNSTLVQIGAILIIITTVIIISVVMLKKVK